jgi:hypothetical protein
VIPHRRRKVTPLRRHAENERIVGDDEAEKLLRAVSYRSPWEFVPD